MTRACTLAVILSVGVLAAFEAPLGLGADPAPTPAVVTVQATYQHRGVQWWARRAVQARKDANARGQTIRALHTDVRRLKRAARAGAASSIVGTINAFLCIHFNPRVGHGEGPWDANTGNGYHGGLQMDWPFMRHYGAWAIARWGPAENWPPEVQIVVALTAYYSGRGFYPWPQTARNCGLI